MPAKMNATSLDIVLERLNCLQINHTQEGSTKFTPRQLIVERYLLGVFTKLLTPRSLDGILAINSDLGMPDEYLTEIRGKLRRADWLLMGQESNDQYKVQKLYLEYNENLRFQTHLGNGHEPVRIHDGYKWNPDDSSLRQRAYYDCFPGITRERMTARIHEILGGHAGAAEAGFVAAFLECANRVIPVSEMTYLEVSEENNSRRSFDIAIHKARLPVAHFAGLFGELARFYSSDLDKLETFLPTIAPQLMGHFSGGIDRHGHSFVTLYYSLGAGGHPNRDD